MKIKMNKSKLYPVLAILAFVILAIIVGALLSNNTTNEELTTETAKEKFTYTVLGESIIIDSYIGEDTNVVVPAKIDGVVVNSIGPNAFANKDVVSVLLPDTITAINISAFSNCTKLKDINLPDSLEFLAAYSFYKCESLEEITIPDKIVVVCISTFEDCTNLKKVKFGEELTEIGERAFKNTSVENIVLPDKLSIIRYYAFDGCENLTKVKIPNSLISVADNSFIYKNISFNIDDNQKVEEFINNLKK